MLAMNYMPETNTPPGPPGDDIHAMQDEILDAAVKNNRKNIFVTIAVLLCFAAWGFFNSGGNDIILELGDEQMRIGFGDQRDIVIAYADISSLVMVEDFVDLGSLIADESRGDVLAGEFHSGAVGPYRLFAYAEVPSIIYVHHAEGVLAFNCISAEQTFSVYEELLKKSSYGKS
jgi:hypothetical protein